MNGQCFSISLKAILVLASVAFSAFYQPQAIASGGGCQSVASIMISVPNYTNNGVGELTHAQLKGQSAVLVFVK